MKIGFSSQVCPGWDLETIIRTAASLDFDGVELGGLAGEKNLPGVAELAKQPDEVRRKLEDHGIELVCLDASASLDSCWTPEIIRQQTVITEHLELAEKLGCRHVRIPVGKVQRLDNHGTAIARIADALISMVPIAEQHDVTLLVENGGDFAGSADLWFLIDAVGHPSIRCCWNQCAAMTIRERPTVSIPRLVSKIGLVRLGDASFSEQGSLLECRPLGQGDVEVARQIELLRGLVYNGYLVFHWPRTTADALPEPQTALPKAAEFLREWINAEQAVLSAYKGDKRPVKMVPRRCDTGGA